MKTSTPSASALAQKGWNFGSLSSAPSTLPPIAAPRRPYFLTPSSSCLAARSGNCRATEANARKRSGVVATASASFSFCTWMIFSARSRSALYQKGLMLSTCRSMPCSSIAASRAASAAPICRSGRSDGPPSLRPMSAMASGTAQCACTSMTLARLPAMMVWRLCACAFAVGMTHKGQPTKSRLATPELRKSRRPTMRFLLKNPAYPRGVSPVNCNCDSPVLRQGHCRSKRRPCRKVLTQLFCTQ
jgi:hypothetical protein